MQHSNSVGKNSMVWHTFIFGVGSSRLYAFRLKTDAIAPRTGSLQLPDLKNLSKRWVAPCMLMKKPTTSMTKTFHSGSSTPNVRSWKRKQTNSANSRNNFGQAFFACLKYAKGQPCIHGVPLCVVSS